MYQICTKYIPNIYQIYTKYIPNIYQIFTKNLQKIYKKRCKKFVKKLPRYRNMVSMCRLLAALWFIIGPVLKTMCQRVDEIFLSSLSVWRFFTTAERRQEWQKESQLYHSGSKGTISFFCSSNFCSPKSFTDNIVLHTYRNVNVSFISVATKEETIQSEEVINSHSCWLTARLNLKSLKKHN
jgi:hypothetical protein